MKKDNVDMNKVKGGINKCSYITDASVTHVATLLMLDVLHLHAALVMNDSKALNIGIYESFFIYYFLI